VRFAFEQVDQFLQSAPETEPEVEAGALRPDESGKQKATGASLALTMQYKGLQRASALALTDDGLEQLIIEGNCSPLGLGRSGVGG
jgi:hypothetical protein